jgi:hypothetical protein
MRDDSLWQIGVVASRKRIVFPVNVFYRLGNFRNSSDGFFAYLNLNVPFEVQEEYELVLDFEGNSDVRRDLAFKSNVNLEIRAGLGIIIGKPE